MNYPPMPPPPAPGPRRRWGRIALIALSVVLVLIAIAIMAGPIIAPGIIRGKLQQALAERVNGRAEVGEVTFSWSGKIEVSDIVIFDSTGGEALRFPRAELHVDLWGAWSGDYNVQGSVERPRVVLRRMPSGRLNLEELIKPSTRQEPEPTFSADVTFDDAEVYVDEPEGVSQVCRVKGSFASAGTRTPSSAALQASFERGVIDANLLFTIADGSWRADYAVKGVDLRPAEPLARLLTPARSLGGDVNGDGEVDSRGNLRGRAEISNLAVGVGGDPVTFPRFSTTYSADGSDYRMTLDAGRAIVARADGRREGAAVRGRVDVEGDLAEMGEALRQILNVKPDATLRGSMRGHADVVVENVVDVKSTFELRDVEAVDKSGKAYTIDPRVEVRFDGKVGFDSVTADLLTVTSDTVTAKAQGAVSGLGKGQTPLASRSTIDVKADLDLLRRRLAPLVDFGSAALSGQATFAGVVSPLFDGLEIDGRGSATRLAVGEFGPIDITLDGDVEIVGNDSTLKRFEVVSSAGRVSVKGTVRGVTELAEAELDVSAWLAPTEAAKALRPWLQGVTVSGVSLDLTGRVTGPIRRPSGTLHAVGRGVVVDKAGPLDFTADATVRNFDFEKLDFDSTAVTANLTGSMSDFSGRAVVRPDDFVRAFGPYLQGVAVRGTQVDLSGRVTGGPKQPAGTVRVVAKSVAVEKAEPLDFTADVTFRGVDVEKLEVESSALSASLTGSIRDAGGRVTIKPEAFSRAFHAYLEDVSMRGAPVELSGRVKGDARAFTATVAGKTGDMVVDNQAIPPFKFDAEIVRANDRFEKVIVKAPGIDVVGSGRASEFDLRGTFDPRTASDTLGPFLKGTKLDGRPVQVVASVRHGTVDTVTGFVEAPEIRGTIHEKWIAQKRLRVDFDFDWAPGVYDVRLAKASSDTGRATAQGRIEERPTGYAGRLDVTAEGDLATLMRDVAGSVTKPGATEYGGALSIRSTVVGSADIFNATGDLTIRDLTARRPEGSAVDPNFNVRHEATIDLRTKTLTIRRGDVTSTWMRGTIAGDVLTFNETPTFRGFTIDLRYKPAVFGKFLALFLPGEFVGSDEQTLSAKLDGPPAAFDLFGLFNGTTGTADMVVKSYVLQGTTVEGPLHGVVGGGGRMTISGTLKGNGGTIVVDKTEIDFRDASMKPATTFYARGENIGLSKQLAKVLTSFHPFFVGGEVLGTVKFDTSGQWVASLKSDADLKSALLVGKTMMAIPDLELKDAPFLSTILSFLGDKDVGPRGYFVVTDMAARDGAFKYTDMVFSLQGLTLRFRGTVGFDGKLDLVMDTPITTRLYERNKNLQPFLGKTMPVPVRGSLSEPKIFWDEGFKNLFKDAPKNILEGVLNDLLNPKKNP